MSKNLERVFYILAVILFCCMCFFLVRDFVVYPINAASEASTIKEVVR